MKVSSTILPTLLVLHLAWMALFVYFFIIFKKEHKAQEAIAKR